MSAGKIISGGEVKQDVRVSCDVCIVGSGAGGAVLAHGLVSRGLSVVVLEEGGHFTRDSFDMREDHAYPNLFQELGNRTTDDLAVMVLQGKSVGGGTTVNWCSSFRTPPAVLSLWQEAHGAAFDAQTLAPHFDALEERLHIAPWPLEQVNPNNRVLWDGLGALGYQRGLVPRNVKRCANLGYCGLGCPIDAKQSMLVTYLPEAVERGLTLYANAWAHTIESSGRRATRVVAQVLDGATDRPTGRSIQVNAKVVVASGGAINSPALLLRSGLDGGGRVGKRTFLHPTVASGGFFDEVIEPFYGAPQSVYSHEFSDRGPGKLGFFLEVAPAHPMLAAVFFNGMGEKLQGALARLSHLNAMLAIVIDGLDPADEGGTVALRGLRERRLSLRYPFTSRHLEAFQAASKALAKVQFAAGAKSVMTMHAEPLELTAEAELGRLDQARYGPLEIRVATAHQMGGCTLGRDPKRSVVDPSLRYHGLDNLFVVDGSVFPSGLGVNPQLTIFAIARWATEAVAAAV